MFENENENGQSGTIIVPSAGYGPGLSGKGRTFDAVEELHQLGRHLWDALNIIAFSENTDPDILYGLQPDDVSDLLAKHNPNLHTILVSKSKTGLHRWSNIVETMQLLTLSGPHHPHHKI